MRQLSRETNKVLDLVEGGETIEIVRGGKVVAKPRGGRSAPITVSSPVRTREYLTGREIERLMAAARSSSRSPPRAT